MGARFFETDTQKTYRWVGQEWIDAGGSGGPGVSDHGQLTGLGDDDHSQYHNDTRAESWHGALPNPHHSNANDPASGEKLALAGTSGTPSGTNKYVTNSDSRNSDARTPLGHSHAESDVTNLVTDLAAKVVVAGQIGGTAASPDVRGVRETAGPTLLTLGAVADGQYLRRSGSTVIGGSPGGSSSPSWYGVLHGTQNGCDPIEMLREWTMTAVAGPTPTGITVSIARCVLFRNPAAITINRIRLFGVGVTSSLYKFAIYPRGAGSARTWESGTVTTAANTWLAISAGLPISLLAGTEYWFCVTAASTGTTAGFRSLPAPVGANFWGADVAPLGNRGLALGVFAQFAVNAGAFPATLPAIAAAAYAGGTTGSVSFALLDSIV